MAKTSGSRPYDLECPADDALVRDDESEFPSSLAVRSLASRRLWMNVESRKVVSQRSTTTRSLPSTSSARSSPALLLRGQVVFAD
jgi:hypothetical protein